MYRRPFLRGAALAPVAAFIANLLPSRTSAQPSAAPPNKGHRDVAIWSPYVANSALAAGPDEPIVTITPGDAQSLVDAMAAAPGNSTLVVPPGTYNLSAPLDWRPVNLISGGGVNDTAIVGAPGQDVLRVQDLAVANSEIHRDTIIAGINLRVDESVAASYTRVLPDGSVVGAAGIASAASGKPLDNHVRVKILHCKFSAINAAANRGSAATYTDSGAYGWRYESPNIEQLENGIVQGITAPRRVTTVDMVTNRLTIGSHPFAVNDRVMLIGAGTAPTGFAFRTVYDILAVGADYVDIGDFVDAGTGDLYVAPAGSSLGEYAHDEMYIEAPTISTNGNGWALALTNASDVHAYGGKAYYGKGCLAVWGVPSGTRTFPQNVDININAEGPLTSEGGVTHVIEGRLHRIRTMIHIGSNATPTTADISASQSEFSNLFLSGAAEITLSGDSNDLRQILTAGDLTTNGKITDSGMSNRIAYDGAFTLGLEQRPWLTMTPGLMTRGMANPDLVSRETPTDPDRVPSDLFLDSANAVEQAGPARDIVVHGRDFMTIPAAFFDQTIPFDATNGSPTTLLVFGGNLPARHLRVFVRMKASAAVSQEIRAIRQTGGTLSSVNATLTTTWQVFSLDIDGTSEGTNNMIIEFRPLGSSAQRDIAYMHVVPFPDSLAASLVFSGGQTLKGADVAALKALL